MPSAASPRATSVSAARTLSAIANFGSAACHAPSFSSAALAYLPTGTALTSPVAILPSPASLARSKPWPIVDIVDLGILRRDQHDAVAEQIDPRRLVDGLLVDRIVHPVGVGGQEDIRRRALFDLFGQRRARGIAGDDLDAGLRGIGGIDVVERVLHRSRGKHREALVLGETQATEADPHRMTKATKSPARRCMGALRACSRRCSRAQIRRWLNVECDRRKRRSADPGDLRSIGISQQKQ